MKKKITVIAVILLLVAYCGSYGVMRSSGGYRFDQSGLVRYASGMSASDLEMWHPRHAWFQAGFVDVNGKSTSRGNALGYLFSPLIQIDRTIFHKTVVIEELRKAAGVEGEQSPP